MNDVKYQPLVNSRIHYMELKEVVVFALILHHYTGWNPLHGVESTSSSSGKAVKNLFKNPLHGVESNCRYWGWI